MLKLGVDQGLAPGSYSSSLEFRLDDEMTLLEQDSAGFDYEVMSAWAAFREQYSGFLSGAGMAIFAGVLFAGVLFGGGSFLNRFYLAPRLKMKSDLFFYKEGANPHPVRGKEVKYDLAKAGKKEVRISIGDRRPDSDYVIPDREYEYDMIISNHWHDNLPGFLRGWKALLTRQLVVETAVKCTPPGVLVTGGRVVTGTVLQPEDSFESSGYRFRFAARPDKGTHVNNAGKNILDGKS